MSQPPLAPATPHQTLMLHHTTTAAAWFTLLLGGFMVVVWLNGALWLDHFLPGLFYLKFNTALGFLFAGASLLASLHKNRRLAIVAASVILLLSATALIEYISGQRWGLSELVVTDFYHPAALYPGRMAPNTATAFICAALCLILGAASIWPRHASLITQEVLACAVLGLGATGLIGHISATSLAFTWGSQTGMAVSTSLGFLALGAGIAAQIWSRQPTVIARVPLWLPALLCALPLLLDISAPPGFPAGLTYVPLVVCALWFTRATTGFVFAAIASLLLVLGALSKSPNIYPVWVVIATRCQTIAMLWSMAGLIYFHRTGQILLGKQQQNQTLLDRIVETSDDGFITKSLDGIILTWNEGAERLFGYTAQEIIGHPISLLIPPEFREDERYILSHILLGQNVNDYETTRIHKDGHLIDVSISITAMRDKSGQIAGASKIVRDVSRRKRAEAALKRSEQKYELVLQAMSVGVWEWNISTGTLDCSPRFMEILGWDPQKYNSSLTGFGSLVHPQDLERVLAALQVHLDQNIPYDIEYRIRNRNDHYVWIHATGKAEKDTAGTPLRMIGSADDITSRKQSEEKFRLVVETAPYAIIIIGKSGEITLINRKTEQFFGYTREALIGKPIEILVPLHLRASHPDLRAKFFASPSIATADSRLMAAGTELMARRSDGGEFPVEIGLTPLATENGIMVLSTIIDITQRKREEENARLFNQRLEQLVTERTAQLAAANHELEEFAFVASHDLKAPLRVIDNCSKWIEEDLRPHLTADTLENMTLMRGRVKRMEKLLDDLLEYSKIGKKSDPRANEIIKGEELMENIIALLCPPPGFKVEIYPGFAALSLPRMPLQQILMNLIGNAIKHHDKKTGHIEIAVENLPEFYAFTVKDDGPGIAPQFHAEIFKMFQTLKPRDQVEGSGMGLAMVRKHVEAAGGTLDLVSAEGEGSIFRFTWPKTPVIKVLAA